MFQNLWTLYSTVSDYLYPPEKNYFYKPNEYYLEVPESVLKEVQISADSNSVKFDLGIFKEQSKHMPKCKRFSVRELRGEVPYHDSSQFIFNDEYYQNIKLIKIYLEMIDLEAHFPNEMTCQISFDLIEHPVMLLGDNRVCDFSNLHEYLKTNVREHHLPNREVEIYYKAFRDNKKMLGCPSVSTDLSFINMADAHIKRFYMYMYKRFESNADSMQAVYFLRYESGKEDMNKKFEDLIPSKFYCEKSGLLMLRPIYLSENNRHIDLSQYKPEMGSFILALDLMKEMEDFVADNKNIIYPSNHYYCPF